MTLTLCLTPVSRRALAPAACFRPMLAYAWNSTTDFAEDATVSYIPTPLGELSE